VRVAVSMRSTHQPLRDDRLARCPVPDRPICGTLRAGPLPESRGRTNAKARLRGEPRLRPSAPQGVLRRVDTGRAASVLFDSRPTAKIV